MTRPLPFFTLGLAVAVLTAWLGDYAFSHVRFEFFGDEFGPRVFRTVLLAAPFLLTALFLDQKSRALKRPAIAASRVAAGIVLAGPILILGFQFYSARNNVFGPTGGALLEGILIMTTPVWLTALAIVGFTLTDALVSKRNVG